jgi:hypothetical protein
MQLAKRKEYPIVEVIWHDAEEFGEVGWNDIKGVLAHAKVPCPEMHTVGYCVHKDRNHISLLSTIGPKECSTLEKIPMSMIQNVRVIKEVVKNANV